MRSSSQQLCPCLISPSGLGGKAPSPEPREILKTKCCPGTAPDSKCSLNSNSFPSHSFPLGLTSSHLHLLIREEFAECQLCASLVHKTPNSPLPGRGRPQTGEQGRTAGGGECHGG